MALNVSTNLMRNIKQHIGFKVTTTLLMVTLLVPTMQKFAHAFSNHKHEVCTGVNGTHIHNFDVECEFYKFKINSSFTFTSQSYNILEFKDNHSPIISQYYFISDYQKLPFSLRGPPYNG